MEEKRKTAGEKNPLCEFCYPGHRIPHSRRKNYLSGGELTAYIVKEHPSGIYEMGKNILETGSSEGYVSKQHCADFGILDK